MMADMTLFLEKELNTEYKPRPVGKGIMLRNKETFVLGIIATQYLNRHHNMKIAKTMTEGRTVKSKALLNMARQCKDADSFIRGAISTQVAAGRYDVLYKKYLMMRHKKIMKRPEVKAFVRELEGPSPVALK